MKEGRNTPCYTIIADKHGNRYRFYCGRSGIAVCTTGPVCAQSAEEELRLAWENEARRHFDRCSECGRWVSDLMFNVDTSKCVVCSPWEAAPDYCPYCGEGVQADETVCRRCGKKLQYREG